MRMYYMANYLIGTTLIFIGLLVFVMLLRVRQLYLSDKYAKVANYEDIIDWTASLETAYRFADKQVLLIETQLDAKKIDSVSSLLKETVGLYLIGAVEAIGKEKDCSAKSRRMLMIKVLESSLNLSSVEVGKYYAHAYKRKQHDSEECIVRVGAKAAKEWMKYNTVSENLSLESQLAEYCSVV